MLNKKIKFKLILLRKNLSPDKRSFFELHATQEMENRNNELPRIRPDSYRVAGNSLD